MTMARSDVLPPEFESGSLPSVAPTSTGDTSAATLSKQDMHVQTREVLQTIATLEMYRAQREVANYMELAYLRLADHPDQASEVRMTAHSARTQHIMTAGLMKKFTVTANHIVKTMIPMVLDAVTELQSAEVVKDIFAQIIQIAEEMKIETESTQKRYLEIQAQVQEAMVSVNKRNKFVVDEQKRLNFEMEREKQLARAAQLAQEELNEEKQMMEEELERLQSKREECWTNAETARKDIKDSKSEHTFFDSVLAPGPALAGGAPGLALGFLSSTVNFFTGLFNSDKRSNNLSKLMDAYRESQNAVERTSDKRRDVVVRMQTQRKEALERLATLKMLGTETATLGNVESLREAHAQLGNVDRQFTRIIEFWSGMAAGLKILRDDTTSSKSYLLQIENPKHADRFKKSIERAENGWRFFGRICSDYVQENDTEIYSLYNFLSAPIDNMGTGARAQRQRELLLKIEDEINISYPKDDE